MIVHMNFKTNTKQKINTIQGLRSFKDTLPKEARRILNKKGQIYNQTLDNWKYIVGKELFKICYPKSFKSGNKINQSCLNVMVKRGSEVEVEYSKNAIIKKLNAYFGYEVVQKIKLNTFEGEEAKDQRKRIINATKNKHINKIINIKNEKIKNSLLELSRIYNKK